MKPNRRWRIKLLWLFLGLGLAFTTLAATRSSCAVVAQTTAQPPPPVTGRAGPIDPASPLPPAGAPGYCPSAGGSTTYEQILNVTFIPKDDLLEVTIPIQIANPNGCTYGKPCPSYDNSPEYVNGWIDWNGNQQWEAGEQVINKDLRAASINYHGTMTVKDQVRIPATSVESTWLRANLGYGYDANDPCTGSWEWGNVVDKPIAPKASLIKEIKVKGEKEANNPMTGYYVTLEAVLDLPSGYTVEKIRWSGDVEMPGEGNPYSFKPFKGEHGLRKVKATLTYHNSATNTTGTVAKEHEFKLFFEKNGDDDGDGLINWFEYWGRDGAVPGLLPKAGYAPLVYDPKDPDYGTWKDQEQLITLGVGVANEWHYEGGRTVPVKENCVGGTFGGTAGIDAVAEVISHERWHEFIWRQWHGGPWQVGVTLDTDDKTPNQKGDNTGDDLPDDFERNDSRTNPDIVDSCNLVTSCSGCWTYKGYADNEFTALLASKIASTVPAQDWANPGKQSNPPFVPKGLLAAAAAVDKASGPLSGASPVGATTLDIVDAATLTSSYVDSSLDANGDGQAETLRITVGVNVITPAQYTLIGWLRDSNGVDFAWASVRADLTAGDQAGELDFDGKLFQTHGVNGPYTLHHVELRVSEGSAVAAFADNVYTTAAYAAGSFTPPAVSLTGSYSDHGVDTDNDGLYNALDVTVDIQINIPGAYTVQGWLYDANGQPIAGGDARAAFSGSGTQTLTFQGRSLRWQRADGPYQVRFLEVLDAALNRVLLVEHAYTTAAYMSSQFQGANAAGAATINPAGYSDQGLDVNGDGKFEYVRVALQVNATTAGAYHLEAALQVNARTTLVSAENDFALVSGNNAMTLDFPGGALSANGANGPYQVAAVTLLDSVGNVVDYQKLAHATQSYAYTDFAPPLISLTNQYREEARDTNGDGGYDLLNIAVGVMAGNNGFVVAQGRLVDSGGHEIQWVEQTVPVTAGVAQSVTLPFSATLIVANGQDGPYYLRNLLLYHTGDPLQALSVANAYITAAYHYRDFLPAGPRMLYLPVVAKAPPTPTPTPPPDCVSGTPGEPNDVADAILICSGQPVTGQVSQSDKDDVYRFKAATNQGIDIVLHGTGGDADLYLFAPGTTNVTSDPWAARSVQEGNDELIQGTLLVGGDWFVDVFAFSGATEYSLVVTLSSTEASSAQATMTVIIGDPLAGSRSSK